MESKELESKLRNIEFTVKTRNTGEDPTITIDQIKLPNDAIEDILSIHTAEVERATLAELENLLLTKEGDRYYVDFSYLSNRIKELQPPRKDTHE